MAEFYVAPSYSDPYYANEGIEILWGTKVIFVPKSETVLVQSTPTEIRTLDINVFRLALKDLEDSVEGMANLDTHRHGTQVVLGGVTYARVVEIINGFTIVFEDGQYAVNLVGANSNIADKVSVNHVSVRAANSAGLVVTSGALPSDVADAVWAHSAGTTLSIRLLEAWGRLGLDPLKPLVTGQTEISFGDIVMALAETEDVTVTVTRQ